ncbi:L,D-transpeptidase family protein (plasmid) [Lentzea sp. JNUCC 0626]|uniref:L,D-transpeptidase n=1 Tax=Lentzea sp. JNUCC 0626 TaxID=3367513 RepID=UPI003749ADD7
MIDDDGDRPEPADRDDERQDPATGPNTPSGERSSFEQPPAVMRRRRPVLMAIGGLVAVAVILAVVALATRTSSGPAASTVSVATSELPPAAAEADGAPVVAPRPVSDSELATLPQATTFGEAPNAPRDPAPDQAPSGKVVHPNAAVPVFASPGGDPVAVVPAQQPIGIAPHQTLSDTWLPIVAEQPGWALVGLPLRPNGSVAWMYVEDPAVTVSSTPSVITVDRGKFELTLTTDGAEVGRWTVGTGKPSSVTPAGRTFLLAAIREAKPTFSPIVLPLGAHSDTYESYGGGPGTVGVHTWPTADVYGKPSSDGCIRVPPEALQVLTKVPLGTAVLIK